MILSTKPKSTLIAYCVLADRLRTPGVGVMQALTPFLAEACKQFSGDLFDAEKFSKAVAERYGIPIPRLAVLGLAEQLASEGLLKPMPGHARSTVYQYTKTSPLVDAASSSPVTEAEVETVLASFVACCRMDTRLSAKDDESLHAAFLNRLLNADSMRILGRREVSISTKKTADTLILKKPSDLDELPDHGELHLDFLVSQFLIDLRDNNAAAFERVSNVAFANMAAEAIACFREPANTANSLDALTVYLDSPLLLDMLGVNTEYADYGRELLDAIQASGAKAAIHDHCVVEAEAAIHAQLAYLRSGINQVSTAWGTTAKPDILNALIGNVGERAEKRLGISVHRDPEINLHRRAQTTVGDIETEMNRRMEAWGKADAKDHDRRSVWAMLAIRDIAQPCPRICDSKYLFLARNTALVRIANDAWVAWLKGATTHSSVHIERWAPVAMSDKQFAGYLWARSGVSNGSISRARLLAHCSAAVRPRADVKARAYNLVLELSGCEAADDIAALLEDREGARALMRATTGDPEDVTPERLPFVIEKMKLAAGEYAAAAVRVESERQLEETRAAHNQEVERLRDESATAEAALGESVREARELLLQQQQDQLNLASQNAALLRDLAQQTATNNERKVQTLRKGLASGTSLYRLCRWAAAVLFGAVSGQVALLAVEEPAIAAGFSALIATLGFWFVPDILNRPLSWLAMKQLRSVVAIKDANIDIPSQPPDFKSGTWSAINNYPTTGAINQEGPSR
jgi:hypothetical protein